MTGIAKIVRLTAGDLSFMRFALDEARAMGAWMIYAQAEREDVLHFEIVP